MSLHGAERSYIEVLTERGVSEYDREASTRIMRRPWPTRGCCAVEKQLCISHKEHLSVKDVENGVLWQVTPRGLLDKNQFLSTSAKLRKATISCFRSVRRPFPSNNSGLCITIFMKFRI